MSHKVNHFNFGNTDDMAYIEKTFKEGNLRPLDEVERVKTNTATQTTFEYYLKVVPTHYTTTGGTQYAANQFTANTHEINGAATAIYFRYEMSSVMVNYTQTGRGFLHFLVEICAIIGGVFVAIGIVNSLIRTSVTALIKGNKGS